MAEVEQVIVLTGSVTAVPVGTDVAGKSAYEYALEGGYTGTEEEFAAKLAAEFPETLPNPHALTFAGAANATYDGSATVTIVIPEGIEGPPGPAYTLTEADKAEITQEVLAALPAWNGGSY